MSEPAPSGTARAAALRPSFAHGAARIFDLSLGQMLWSRRTIFMILVLVAPIVLALVVRFVEAGSDHVALSRNLGDIVWRLYVRFIVPVLGVFYGTSLIADEVDDRTITYLFTRPVPRRAVLVGRYVAYFVCTALLVLPSLTIVAFLVARLNEIGSLIATLPADLAVIALGLAVYGAFFGLVGAVMKRPLVVGLVLAFGWEQMAMLMPGYVRRFTIVYYLQGLVPHALPSDDTVSMLAAVVNDTPGTWTSLGCLAATLVVSLALGMLAVERREYVLGQ